MGRSSDSQCHLCQAAAPFRKLAEGMRSLGISQRDIGDFLTHYKDFPISHAAVGRHDAHFKFEEVPVPVIGSNGEVSIQLIAKHKLSTYWETQKDAVPSDSEARAWGRLLIDLGRAGLESERTALLRGMFQPQAALPEPAIDVEVIEVVNANPA